MAASGSSRFRIPSAKSWPGHGPRRINVRWSGAAGMRAKGVAGCCMGSCARRRPRPTSRSGRPMSRTCVAGRRSRGPKDSRALHGGPDNAKIPLSATISTLVGCGGRSRGASTRTDRPARLAHTLYAGVSAEGDGAHDVRSAPRTPASADVAAPTMPPHGMATGARMILPNRKVKTQHRADLERHHPGIVTL